VGRGTEKQPLVSEDWLSRFHPEVMPVEHQAVLRRLAPLASEAHFYLGGGTAVAIMLGHRRSLDLDWFTPNALADPAQLVAALEAQNLSIEVTATSRGTLHAIADGVRLSWLEYRYPLIQPLQRWSDYECSLASREDLICMKLSAITSRGAKRDFIDLHALAGTDLRLREMLDLYRRKFGLEEVASVVTSLTYFDDADEEADPSMIWKLEWSDVKQTFERWVNDYVD